MTFTEVMQSEFNEEPAKAVSRTPTKRKTLIKRSAIYRYDPINMDISPKNDTHLEIKRYNSEPSSVLKIEFNDEE